MSRNSSSSRSSSPPGEVTPGSGFDTPGLPLRVLRKAETVLQRRTSRLAVVIEKTVDVHSYSAVLRTAEALGVQNVYLIAPPLKPGPDDTFVPFDSSGRASKNQSSKNSRKKRVWSEDVEKAKRHNGYARTACKWITLKNFNSTEACLKELRKDGYEVWVTDLGQVAEPLVTSPPMDFPDKLAICFGTESTGATPYLLSQADKRVYLPLTGFADSLNLSVAAGLVIQEIMRLCPRLTEPMSESERCELRRLWYPSLARSETEAEEYAKILEEKSYPQPFEDMRRADLHREGWAQKKVVRKNEERYRMLKEEEAGEGGEAKQEA